ncbi:MAG: hypothetical protein RR139_09520 [Lachnospiraceae bacterium]
MKIARKEQKILLYAGGILVLMLVWVFVFQKAQERNLAVADENMKLYGQLKELQVLAQNEDDYQEQIKKMKAETDTIYNLFPVSVKEETTIMYGYELEQNSEMKVDNVEIGMPNLLYTVGKGSIPVENGGNVAEQAEKVGNATDAETKKTEEAAAQAEGTAPTQPTQNGTETPNIESMMQDGEKHLFATDVNYNFAGTYAGMKTCMAYLLNTAQRKTLQNIALTFDSETGNLMGNMSVRFYALSGTDKVYEEPWIPSMPTGTDNIFGTVEAAPKPVQAAQE